MFWIAFNFIWWFEKETWIVLRRGYFEKYLKNIFWNQPLHRRGLLNFQNILLAPLVVIFKSKRLNKAILFMEHFIVVILFVLALSITIIIVFVPVLLLFLVQKVINHKRFVKTSSEHIIRIIDFFVSMFVAPFLLGVLAITHVIGETMVLYKTNILRNVEVHKNENNFINDLMDITLPHHNEKLDSFQLSKMYYAFKKFTNTVINTKFGSDKKWILSKLIDWNLFSKVDNINEFIFWKCISKKTRIFVLLNL